MTIFESTLRSCEIVRVTPAKCLRGELRLPGDKSISHRAAIIASLSTGPSVVKNFSTARDCQSTVDCLQALGVPIDQNNSTLTITGTGGLLPRPAQALDAGNSGTTMRLLAGVLSAQPFETVITGDTSLRSRPMRRVAAPLEMMGASITTTPEDTAPLRIQGRRPLQAIHYSAPVASAQIKSAVLLAGLFADGLTTVVELCPTRDHTERLLNEFSAEIFREGNSVGVRGGAQLLGQAFMVPGDISSAAFFIAAASILEGSDLTIRDVGLNPTRTGFLKILSEWGLNLSMSLQRIEGGEPAGTVRVHWKRLDNSNGFTIRGARVVDLIDELPLLAFIAAARGCALEVHDATELRVKESDRIAATVHNLRAMGARVEEHADGFTVERGTGLHGARLDSFSDHRMAMALTVAALSAKDDSEIVGTECVDISFPEFYQVLESLIER